MSDVWIEVRDEDHDEPFVWDEPVRPGPRQARPSAAWDDLSLVAARPLVVDLSYTVRDVLDPEHILPAEDLPILQLHQPDSDRYASLLRQSFNFLRQHGDRRYSDNTLMRIVRAAETAESNAVGVVQPMDNMPWLVLVESPSSYDEETEVKTGGISAMAVCWKHNDGKTVLATHRSLRRKKLGTLVARGVQNAVTNDPSYWVAGHNAPGQQFLLSMGLQPTSLNNSGAVRYSYGLSQED